MSVRLLWHTATTADGAPIHGLCLYEGKELIIAKDDYNPYNDSQFKLYSCQIDELSRFKSEHEKLKLSIGGINDYGNEFKPMIPLTNKFCGLIKNPIVPTELKLVTTVRFEDISNPYQSMK